MRSISIMSEPTCSLIAVRASFLPLVSFGFHVPTAPLRSVHMPSDFKWSSSSVSLPVGFQPQTAQNSATLSAGPLGRTHWLGTFESNPPWAYLMS